MVVNHNCVKVSEAALTAAAASRHALMAPNNMYKFQRHGSNDIHVEVRHREELAATGKSDARYVKHCTHSSEMLRFCSLVSDHSSGLLFDHANTPINPIPCHPATVLAFMNYKCYPSELLLSIMVITYLTQQPKYKHTVVVRGSVL
jgi:hypothetical protein